MEYPGGLQVRLHQHFTSLMLVIYYDDTRFDSGDFKQEQQGRE